jgi:RNA polymerase sigma factor (sigma-70 family)
MPAVESPPSVDGMNAVMSDGPDVHDELPPLTDTVTNTLVAQHRKFLAFLEKRVESRAVAEEILQSAFVKSMEKQHQLQSDESAVAWFYRLLRNAVIDHYRRRDAQGRALEKHGIEMALSEHMEPEAQATICACINELIPTLKSEYEQLVRAVDLEGKPVSDAARALGITANNASVRLHRARAQLKKRLETACSTCAEHGCLDCTCRSADPDTHH